MRWLLPVLPLWRLLLMLSCRLLLLLRLMRGCLWFLRGSMDLRWFVLDLCPWCLLPMRLWWLLYL